MFLCRLSPVHDIYTNTYPTGLPTNPLAPDHTYSNMVRWLWLSLAAEFLCDCESIRVAPSSTERAWNNRDYEQRRDVNKSTSKTGIAQPCINHKQNLRNGTRASEWIKWKTESVGEWWCSPYRYIPFFFRFFIKLSLFFCFAWALRPIQTHIRYAKLINVINAVGSFERIERHRFCRHWDSRLIEF